MTRRAVFAAALTVGMLACTSIDPGSNFVVAPSTFDPDYFYCHVEPQYIFAFKCGPGDPGKGDANNGCHFNSSAVTGMVLLDHPPVNCNGGDHPVDLSMLGSRSPAVANYTAVSFEMNADYTSAAVWVRPNGNTHPRNVVNDNSSVAQILATWAAKSQ
jgi:hypothetical protein